jgi:hypothetical protein
VNAIVVQGVTILVSGLDLIFNLEVERMKGGQDIAIVGEVTLMPMMACWYRWFGW